MLAIFGGKPVRKEYLSYGKQWISDEDIQNVVEVLKSDYLTTGPEVAKFEKGLCETTGMKYAVAIANGTAALHAACFAAEIEEGDEVITSPITFAASANAVLYCGGVPVFADVDPNTYNINPESIEKLITERTKAIIPVDYSGRPVEMNKIRDLANRYNLTVIEDAAHGLGGYYQGKHIGHLSDMVEFSFHPVKQITTGEGGAILTNDRKYYEKLKLFGTHGITRERSLMTKKDEASWYYEQIDLGYNYRITDMQCALGLSQLSRLESFVSKRIELAEYYRDNLKIVEEIILPEPNDQEFQSSWHLYVIRLRLEKLNATRNDIFNALKAENIGVNLHYIPVYLHPYYQKLGYKKGICPNAESIYEQMITIPLFPKMSLNDADDVISAIRKVITFYKK